MFDEGNVFSCIGSSIELEDNNAGTIIDVKITNIPCCAMLVTFIIECNGEMFERSSLDFKQSGKVFLLK